jgi:transposase
MFRDAFLRCAGQQGLTHSPEVRALSGRAEPKAKMQFALSDEQWAAIAGLMPHRRKRARADDRRIVSAILYVFYTGIPWRSLPAQYGPYTTAFNRFNRWSRRGIWGKIANTLSLAPGLYVDADDMEKTAQASRRGRKRGERQPVRSSEIREQSEPVQTAL